jgi:hypothetical protein
VARATPARASNFEIAFKGVTTGSPIMNTTIRFQRGALAYVG